MKHFKRAISALLVVVMVLTMLPLTSFAEDEKFPLTAIEGLPTADQAVAIYSAKGDSIFGGTVDGSVSVSAVQKSEETGELSAFTGAGAYKLVPVDSSYYIKCGGLYLATNAAEQLSLQKEPITGTKWNLQQYTCKDDSGADVTGYAIYCSEVRYNNKYDIYIEWYNGFKAWTAPTVTNIYLFNFFAIDEATADPDGDGFVGGKRPSAGGWLPADGDKIVIFNEYAGQTMSFDSEDATSPTMLGVNATAIGEDTIDAGNGSLIFTVHKQGNLYAFENRGEYLRCSPNYTGDGGKVNNDENVYMDALDAEYSWWELTSVTGGYILYNKTGKWGSNKVCIEYFSNSFSGWTYNGSTHLFAMKFFKVEDNLNLGYVLNPKMEIKAENAFIGQEFTFDAVLDELTKVTKMEMTYSTDGGAAKAITASSVDGYKYTFSVPEAALEGKKSLTLKGTATNEYDMVYSGEATVEIKDEPLILSVSPASNEATNDEKRPTISAKIANCGENPRVVMTVDGTAVTPKVTDSLVSYRPASSMTDGRHTISVTITREDKKKTEMTWSFFVGEAGISLYFGQMHSHTAQYSDGAGQLKDAFEYAMKQKDVDFLIVTDHSNYFDTTSTATTTSYYDLSSLSKGNSLTKWEEARATAKEYDEKGGDDFVCGYGYEMTWSGGPGHTNTFNTYGIVSRNNSTLNNKTNYAGMYLYNDLMANANRGLDVDGNPVAEGMKTKYIEDAPVISQFNHPGTTFGTFDEFGGYNPTRDAVLNLVEVGNGEGAVGGSSYWRSYSEYDKALAKGWHVAPTNNQDNHKGKWGNANTCRDVVLTDDFTEGGIYRAMGERRVYSTEDQNLHIYYYLNDELMGAIIDTADEKVDTVHITASISDPDGEKLGKVEIIGENGIALKKFDAPGATYELDTELPNTEAYYYIRVTQADNDIAVTAPVWVGVATPITADIRTDAALSVVDGETVETITAKVDNAAAADYTLKKIVFTLIDSTGEETTIKTINDTSVIPAGDSKTFELEYSREIDGVQTIRVEFYGTYNGKSFKCQAEMEQKVYKAEDLIKVAIDYGHGNFYVSGGYSDNMGNFIKYCADNGAKADFIQKGELTYQNIKNYALLILTVPFDTGKLEPSAYTQDELEAIAKYAKNGGNLIVTTKSDRKSPTGEMNCANITNSILTAIGANVRAADGIIVDNDMKANEAYRIYFSGKENFNTEHPFTKGAYAASNAFGTIPASDNATGFQLYNAAPILINEDAEKKVETLVNGYQTTWGASYEANFDGSAYIPVYKQDKVTAEMGEVNIMTYEELSGGGWLIVSGCTFFSNYDIKDDQNYANKHIVKNILRNLVGEDEEPEITPISTVKKITAPATETGDEYTIEGFVTSNASDYDRDTAFFDCIYMQDREGNGINCFPVAGFYAIGMNVRCHGGVTYYCGEVELNLSPDFHGGCRVISDDIYKVPAKQVNCATAMSDEQIGNLLKVKGTVSGIHKTEGVIDKIYVRDDSGEACLFINGYIMKDYKGLDGLKVGMEVSGIGIGSRDVDETSATSAIFSRLRVRDRSEIVILDEEVDTSELFNDVHEYDWFFDDVVFVSGRQLILGTTNYTFEPDTTLTRAMAVTILYRLAGSPSVEEAVSFDDVKAGEWYADPVAWAETTGVVNGYEDGTFRPDNNLTRQEMVVMLSRYAEKIAEKEIEADGDLTDFSDYKAVEDWAEDALMWAVGSKIIRGNNGRIEPQGRATRAEFATIIARFIRLFDL